MTEQSKNKIIVSSHVYTLRAHSPGPRTAEGAYCTFTTVMPLGECQDQTGSQKVILTDMRSVNFPHVAQHGFCAIMCINCGKKLG